MELSKNYRIVYDENNVILQFHEQRTKEKKDGTKEDYEFMDNLYYPTLKTALKSFVQKEIKHCESIDEILTRIDKLESLIMNKILNKTIAHA